MVCSDDMAGPSFLGLRVLILESRREKEMASLVTSYGGQPVNAPSMREVPLESNTEALEFADRLERGEFDLVILLTPTIMGPVDVPNVTARELRRIDSAQKSLDRR